MQITPYEKRSIRFLELWQVHGWRIKLYGLAYGRERPSDEFLQAARIVIADQLVAVSDTIRHYCIGFAGVHEGRTANFVFVDFWANENELHHHVFMAPLESPDQLQNITGSGLSVCVWDLRLQAFEGDAWVRHVLKSETRINVESYLCDRFKGRI